MVGEAGVQNELRTKGHAPRWALAGAACAVLSLVVLLGLSRSIGELALFGSGVLGLAGVALAAVGLTRSKDQPVAVVVALLGMLGSLVMAGYMLVIFVGAMLFAASDWQF